MAQLNLDQVYQPIGSTSAGSGTMTIEVAAVDVYESNSDVEPANETEMVLTQSLAAGGIYIYDKPAKWLLFKSAGAAVIEENGLVRL